MAVAPAIRIGTRSSPLALAQVELVCAALDDAARAAVQIVPVRTRGDSDPRPFAEIGGRGIFASELERALLDGTIDAAVHSCKDLPLEDTPGLELAAFLPREDPRDALCGAGIRALEDLPEGARIATSSVRRSAALRTLRSDLQPTPIRGNVQTRLAASAARGDAACMLAAAGLRRLGLEHEIGCLLDVFDCVPEAGQGAVVVQVRAGTAGGMWETIDDSSTRRAVGVERRVARQLGGGCDTPVGVHVDLEHAAGYVFLAVGHGAGRVQRAALDADEGPDHWTEQLLAAAASLEHPAGADA